MLSPIRSFFFNIAQALIHYIKTSSKDQGRLIRPIPVHEIDVIMRANAYLKTLEITSQTINLKITENKYYFGEFFASFIAENPQGLAKLAENDYALARIITNETLYSNGRLKNSVKSILYKSPEGRETLAVIQKAKDAKCILHFFVASLNGPEMNINAPIRRLPSDLIRMIAKTTGINPVKFNLV